MSAAALGVRKACGAAKNRDKEWAQSKRARTRKK